MPLFVHEIKMPQQIRTGNIRWQCKFTMFHGYSDKISDFIFIQLFHSCTSVFRRIKRQYANELVLFQETYQRSIDAMK